MSLGFWDKFSVFFDDYEIEKYDENIEYSPEICVICLDIFSENQNILKLECNHYFHENCIKEWFGKKTTCPYCKI